jgi:hypothetical protein
VSKEDECGSRKVIVRAYLTFEAKRAIYRNGENSVNLHASGTRMLAMGAGGTLELDASTG